MINHIWNTKTNNLDWYIYPFWQAQIRALISPNILKNVFNIYIDFADILLSNLATQLLKHKEIQNHIIELINNLQ